jgi:hypothetical protein
MLCSEELQWALNPQPSAQERQLRAIWRGHNAAIGVLEVVARHENANCVYFVQDSVHVMIAYAVVLLVKVSLAAIHDSLE